MTKDQQGQLGSSKTSNDTKDSPRAQRKARRLVPDPENAQDAQEPRRVRSHRSIGGREGRDDWQTPEKNSGQLRKLALVVGAVVAVIAVGMVWQANVGSQPVTAAEHPALSNGSESGEPSAEPPEAGPPGEATAAAIADTAPTNLQQIWHNRISDLDARRIAAFEKRDAAGLAQVNVENSPAHEHDSALLVALESRQVKPVSLASTIHSAKLISGDNEAALVEVVDSRSEYVVTTESMRTIKRFQAKNQTTWRVSLRNINGDWRIYSVVPAKT